MIEAGLVQLGIDHHHQQAKMMQRRLPEINMDVGETKPAAVVVVQESAAAAGSSSVQAPHDDQQMNNIIRCPRCDSSNTKFCYYNNYNLTQPRHFCKSCRRYWTKGGALRNVPFGGGCRKNKNSTAITTTTRCSNKQIMISKSADNINYSSTAPTTCATYNYSNCNKYSNDLLINGTSPNINTSHHQPNSSSGSMSSAIPLQLPAISYLDHQYYSPGAGSGGGGGGGGGGYLPFLRQAAAGNNNLNDLQSKNLQESNCFIGNYGAWPRSAAAVSSGLQFNINNNEVIMRNYNQINHVNGKVLFNNLISSNELLEDQSGEEQQRQQKMPLPPPTLLFPLIPAATAHGSSSSTSWGSYSTSTGCYVEMPAYQAGAATSNSNMQVHHVRDAMPAIVPVTGEMEFWSAPLAWSDVQATTTCTTTSTGAAAS